LTVREFLVTITLNLRGVIFMVVKQDISKTKEVIAGLKNENYSKIYIRTNEDLKSLFKCFSVKDKKVLTPGPSQRHSSENHR